MAEHALIGHQEVGNSFEGTYYVESMYVKQTVQKKDYSDLVLRDKSGGRSVKYWGVVQGLSKGDFVWTAAVVEEYLGAPSIIAKNLEKAEVPEDMSNYIPSCDGAEESAAKFDALRAEISELETKVGSSVAGKLVDDVYNNQAFFSKFVVAPGSAKPVYGKRGGLLASTVRIADECGRMATAYGLENRERAVLLAAALLCRIGAVDAYEFQDCMPVTTKKGVLLGLVNLTMSRATMATKRVAAAMAKAGQEVDQEVVDRVLHAVAAHDSKSVLPMTKEAMVLGAVCRADSEMVAAMDFISNDQNAAEEFTAWDPSMGRKYYVGIREV